MLAKKLPTCEIPQEIPCHQPKPAEKQLQWALKKFCSFRWNGKGGSGPIMWLIYHSNFCLLILVLNLAYCYPLPYWILLLSLLLCSPIISCLLGLSFLPDFPQSLKYLFTPTHHSIFWTELFILSLTASSVCKPPALWCSQCFLPCLLHPLKTSGGSPVKESACQCRRSKRQGFHPWAGKTP